ncbi:hypothetical protein LTS18_006273 [Coniosporium uncinatum]|uniref:Uncharacterized protein n=1 Tax=Coniosporium uncinatum TaxID=93489 RepID=A0ACC3DXV3_9PEZI|nr:hypothetical protein LTS18_006273 [Coniosporium uncinatum]
MLVSTLLLAGVASALITIPEANIDTNITATLTISTPLMDPNTTSRPLEKRSYRCGRTTYYHTCLGACGWVNNDSQYVVALSPKYFARGKYCGKHIMINRNDGKAVLAKIVDLCPGCPENGVDLSPTLFKRMAPLSLGVFNGCWHFRF